METATLTLSDFLLARIAEKRPAGEVVAVQAHADRVQREVAEADALERVVNMGPSSCGANDEPDGWREDFTKNMGWEPERHYPDGYAPGCDGCSAAETANHDHERVLRLLATAYADHPDYDESWRA